MRTMLRGKISLLFMMLGMLLAVPTVAFAAELLVNAEVDSNAVTSVTVMQDDSTNFNLNVGANGNVQANSTHWAKVMTTFDVTGPGTVTASNLSSQLDFAASSGSGNVPITGGPHTVSATVNADSNAEPGTYNDAIVLSEAAGTSTTFSSNGTGGKLDDTVSTPIDVVVVGDADGDDVADGDDNCPNVDNSDQADNDADGIGNACDATPNGDTPTDTTAPAAPSLDLATASDSGASDSDNKTNKTKPLFQGFAEADSLVHVYDGQASPGNPLGNLLGSDVADGTANTSGEKAWSVQLSSDLSEGSYTIKATATDSSNNVSDPPASLGVVIDTTDPSVTFDNNGTPATNLDYIVSTWSNAASVSSPEFTASDSGTDIDFAGSDLAANVYTFTLTVSDESTKVSNVIVPTSTSKTVKDVAGNQTVQNFSALIDRTKPSLGNVDGNNPSYDVCGTARPTEPTFNPSDALSGLATQSSNWVNNTAPSGLGTYTYKASAKDTATNEAFYPGPTATEVKTYNVVPGSAMSSLMQPINTGSTTPSTFKLGSTVPVKFTLSCGAGQAITNSVAKLYLSKIDNSSGAVNEPVATNSPDIGNTFRVTDLTTGQYQFNLSTKASSQFMGPSGNTVTLGEGTWYLYISLDGGEKMQAAKFDLKK